MKKFEISQDLLEVIMSHITKAPWFQVDHIMIRIKNEIKEIPAKEEQHEISK